MAARARKKKRKVSQLGKAKGKMQSGLADASKAARQQALRKQALQKSKSYSERMKRMKSQTKRKLTPAEQRRRKVLGAKATTAKRKLAVQEMDKRIAKIKKGK